MKILKSIYINPEQRRPKQQCSIYYLSKHEDTDIEYVSKDRLAIAEAALETAKLALDSIKSELQRCEADDSGMYHAADKALKAITEANHG